MWVNLSFSVPLVCVGLSHQRCLTLIFWGSLAFLTLPKCSLCYFGVFWCGCWSIFWADPFFSGTLLLFMSIMFSDSFAVKFTGKNYSAWEFQFRLFVMGKNYGVILMGVIRLLLMFISCLSGRSKMLG